MNAAADSKNLERSKNWPQWDLNWHQDSNWRQNTRWFLFLHRIWEDMDQRPPFFWRVGWDPCSGWIGMQKDFEISSNLAPCVISIKASYAWEAWYNNNRTSRQYNICMLQMFTVHWKKISGCLSAKPICKYQSSLENSVSTRLRIADTQQVNVVLLQQWSTQAIL